MSGVTGPRYRNPAKFQRRRLYRRPYEFLPFSRRRDATGRIRMGAESRGFLGFHNEIRFGPPQRTTPPLLGRKLCNFSADDAAETLPRRVVRPRAEQDEIFRTQAEKFSRRLEYLAVVGSR